ncbi:hypothetical protein CHS0354_041346 [Potamilus streckersoni]|uniref:Uncharacterized protein n=1 Tax=Potamilus streckersoni TaxID=2493646 RepID=A0AAE0SEL2_9BIVA|nr:hypothetical protein CHS0354_041346 [Potamilus streckersoni]
MTSFEGTKLKANSIFSAMRISSLSRYGCAGPNSWTFFRKHCLRSKKTTKKIRATKYALCTAFSKSDKMLLGFREGLSSFNFLKNLYICSFCFVLHTAIYQGKCPAIDQSMDGKNLEENNWCIFDSFIHKPMFILL